MADPDPITDANLRGDRVILVGQRTDGSFIPIRVSNDGSIETSAGDGAGQLPMAAPLADGTPNPSVPSLGAFAQFYDPVGDAWNRAQASEDPGIILGPKFGLLTHILSGFVTVTTSESQLVTAAPGAGVEGQVFYTPQLPSTLGPSDTLRVTIIGTATVAQGDGHAATRPPWTVAGTDGASLERLATRDAQTDGSQKTIVRGGAKGVTVAADVTSTNIDANTQGLDAVVKASALPDGAATQATSEAILAALPLPGMTGAGRVAPYRSLLYIAHDPGDLTSLGGNVAFNARCDFALVGGGSLTYLPERRAVRLAVGSASGDIAAYRQRIWNPAIPGTVQHVKFACPLSAAQTNQEKRVGTYDDNDGVYVLQTSSSVLLGIRSSVSGSPVETTTAIPGLDPTLDHILEIRYLWPAGGVEVWSDGELLLFVPKAGGAESPWMRRPNLPFSVEVRNTGASSAGHVDVIYADVHSEGSDTIQQRNVVFSATATTIPTTGKLLAQARVKSSFDLGTITGIPNRNVYHPHRITIETANGPMIIRCYANGTVGGTPSWTAAPTDPGIEYDSAGTFVGADGVLFAIGTIDDTVGTCVIDFTDAFSAFAVSAGAYFGPETLQIVGFARTGNVSSATVTIEAHKIGG